METDLQTVAAIICSILFGYILCLYTNSIKHDARYCKAIHDLLRNFQANPHHPLSLLRSTFATDFNIYLPITTDAQFFERIVKTRNHWNDWLLYEQTFHGHFQGNYHNFCIERKSLYTAPIKHIQHNLQQLIEQYNADSLQTISGENSKEKKLLNDVRKKIWHGLVNHAQFNWSKGAIAKQVNPAYFDQILTELRSDKRMHDPNKLNHYLSLENENEYLLSIDLVTANVQALRLLSPSLLNDCEDYTQFLRQFTNFECWSRSKSIRQRIFGKIIPRITAYVERCLMRIILNEIDALNLFVFPRDLTYSSHDEVVFKLSRNDEELRKKQMKEVTECVEQVIGRRYELKCRVEVFELHVLNRKKKWFVKKYVNVEKPPKLVGVESKYFMMAYNHVFQREEHAVYDRIAQDHNLPILLLHDVDLQYKL